jgi:hypothetical protein
MAIKPIKPLPKRDELSITKKPENKTKEFASTSEILCMGRCIWTPSLNGMASTQEQLYICVTFITNPHIFGKIMLRKIKLKIHIRAGQFR